MLSRIKEVLDSLGITAELGAVDVSLLDWPPLPEGADEAWRFVHDPNFHVPGAKTALVVLVPYDLVKTPSKKGYGRLAAIGGPVDYHIKVQQVLSAIEGHVKDQYPQATTKCFVDKHGLDDRKIAHGAGLAFYGKNKLLIHPRLGSCFNIGYLLTDLALDQPSARVQDSVCGTCTACITACPNGALSQGKPLSKSRCRSYLNQSKEVVDKDQVALVSDWLYGCDLCQLACPYNTNHIVTGDLTINLNNLLLASNKDIQKAYKDRAFGYLGGTRLKRNALVALYQQEGLSAIAPLYDHLKHVPLLKHQLKALGIKD